jgi:diaminohydroxyphosphoribosylaminopyrimidine deaminase/5-amino-6-(5-phosphoribosylamino)uracil reductase
MTRRALDLARRGVGLVSPNPLVGCVILSPDGNVVGEGFYTYDGVTHAEVVALAQAGERARGGTAYVSLEPHGHHGRTAPCTRTLIDAGIKRVVAPIEDPNPLVSGKGFEELREKGVDVVVGLMSDEAARLNEKFCVWHRERRPFVHLKLAMSLDGRISLKRSVSTALSGATALKRVHDLRHEHDVILVGGNTALVDDPALSDRSGLPRRRPLVRVVLDDRLRLSSGSQLARTAGETPTVVFSSTEAESSVRKLEHAGVTVVRHSGRDIAGVLGWLYDDGLQSVLVEGGAAVAGAFCDARLVDKITLIAAPIIVGGEDAPAAIGGRGPESLANALHLKDLTVERLGDDIEITGYPRAPVTT